MGDDDPFIHDYDLEEELDEVEDKVAMDLVDRQCVSPRVLFVSDKPSSVPEEMSVGVTVVDQTATQPFQRVMQDMRRSARPSLDLIEQD